MRQWKLIHYGNARILDPHKSLDELAYPNKLGQKTETKLQEFSNRISLVLKNCNISKNKTL